jgi:beta-alanine degradation protein BauB
MFRRAAASLPLDGVLEHKDKPGDRTSPYHHPDSLTYTLSSFERRLIDGDRETDIELEAEGSCLAAPDHAGENIGTTDTYVLFVELKEPPSRDNS